MTERNRPHHIEGGPEVQPVGRLRRLGNFLENLVIGKQFMSDLRISMAGSSGDLTGLKNEIEKERARTLFANKPWSYSGVAPLSEAGISIARALARPGEDPIPALIGKTTRPQEQSGDLGGGEDND